MSSDRTSMASAGESSVFMGVDVGGTKIRLLASDHLHGDPELDVEERTQHGRVVPQICELVGRHLAGRRAMVAIGVPGVVDPHTQSISNLPYAGGLQGTALRESFENSFGFAPLIENDVNLAAYGVHRELKEPVETLVVVAGGTGIGVGLVVRGNLVRGVRGGAGEVGDLRFAGTKLEDALNSRTLIASNEEAEDPSEAVKQSLLNAAAGDPDSRRMVSSYTDALVALLELLEITLDPGRIELTGGVVSSQAVKAAVRNRLVGSTLNPRVRWAKRGSAAPAWGALEYARWGEEHEGDRGGHVGGGPR